MAASFTTLVSVPLSGAGGLLGLAGISKFVSPKMLTKSMAEALGRSRRIRTGWVRLVAIVEMAAAVLLNLQLTASLGALLSGVLAVGFITLGLLGHLRGSRLPCGCFGSQRSVPLGLENVLFGMGLLGVAALAFTVPAADLDSSVELTGLCIWLIAFALVANRRVIAELT